MLWMSLIAHLVGDYPLQNDWMASQKTSRLLAAVVHAVVYGLPFALLMLLADCPLGWGLAAWSIIVLTHAIIDRWRLAALWARWYRVGQSAPPHIKTWLAIIVDNTLHIIINTLALWLLAGMR